MKISFNPSNSNKNILDLIKNNKDIIFDLKGHSIFARGVEFKGTDTNTWRPVVDNLTSDSTTSSLSAKQGKVLKALIDGKSNSDHNHDGRYLKLTGGTMASNALITFADSGSWDTDEKPQGARGGLYWTGQSDQVKLYAEETTGDNLDLVIQFGDDNSNGLSIRNKSNVPTSYISAGGVITTSTFKGNLDWSYITNKPATATRWPSWAEVTGKPSSFTPSTHTHGLSNSVFFLSIPTISGNAKWKEVFGYPVNYNLLLSVRINSPAPEWCVGNYGSGILYGGSDTKGFMSSAYDEPLIMWAGGNGNSDDSVPKWYIGIRGTHKSIYNLTTIASEANAAYNLRHSHANKSVLDGITSALVNSWNTAYNFVSNITGTDTDKVINKWEEIVNFLAGITEDNKLNTLLNSKLSVYELANNTNVGTIKNNGIYYSTTDASSGTLTNSPFNNGFTLINMTSYNDSDDLRRSRLAFNAYGEIKVSDDRDQANTAETWYNVLTSKNSGINGSTIKLNGTSITVYSSGTADGRYVKKSGGTMLGALNFANNIWNLVGDDSYIGDCNMSGHFGIKAANTTYPGITFFNNASTFLGNLTAYNGNIKYGAYSLQFLDNGNTSVSASTWINPFSAYNSNAVADGQAICVWGQASQLSNLSTDSGDMSLWLKRVNAKVATLNMVLDGCFWQNEGQYRVLDTSDIGDIRNSVTLHQYLSATDVAWYPLVWGGNAHYNTSDSTGAVYKSYDKLSWQTSSQTLYATNIQTNNIKSLSIGGGIYWNPNVESASDGSDVASITVVKSGVAGGTTLVLSQMNDTNDTIQFKTNTAARLYHNSYPILTTQNTYVSNNKGYINGLEITQANYANSAGSVAWNNVTGKPSTFTPSQHTHTWTSITDKIVEGNEFNIVNAGFKEVMWFNYLPINDRSKTATISSYHFGNGARGHTSVVASGFIQHGGNASQLLRADGGVATFNWFGQSGQPTWLWGGNSQHSYYVYNPSNFRVAYAASAGNADTLDGYPANGHNIRPYGHIPTIESDGVMEIGRYIDFHNDNNGKYDFSTRLQSTGNYRNVVNLPSASGTLALINDVNNYYWANVKISTSSSTTTSPTVSNLTATNSIRLGDIHLEHTNEINSYGGLLINYRSSADVDLCQGGGNVCIGATLPTQKLDVRGNIITKGLGIQPYYLSKSVLLPTIRLDDGYAYKCLEISATTEISCIIADRAGSMSERGILIKFNKGYDGQIILLKDLQSYGSGNGYFWVMPSGCKIINADNSSILVGQNQISNTYDDGRSRFLVYSSVYSVWIEFLCSNTF